VATGVRNVMGWIGGLPGKIKSALSSVGSDLYGIGKTALTDLWNGVKNGASGIIGWISGFAKSIVSTFKTIWGWFSPSRVMYEGGKALMEGLSGGIKDHAHKAMAQVTSVAGKVTAGVSQWTGLVRQALSMEGLPLSLTGNVLHQMQTESGGNKAAINLTDSNAAAGDPSRGLLQVIGTTFSAYHWPGTSNNIYDPLANIAAAINYAAHAYGPTLMSGGMGMGSGHGYAGGGATSPGWAVVGEHGRELVKLPGGATVTPAGQSAQMLGAGGGGGTTVVQLEISASGQSAFEAFMQTAIKNWVRVKGGGNVQKAFGRV